jgi:hypothetical protein
MTVLSVDPGERIGVGRWSDRGKLLFNGVITIDDFPDYLSLDSWNDEPVHAVVMEDWRLRQGKQMAQTGSRMLTSQVIGMVRLWAYQHDAVLVLQNSQILRVAAMHANLKLPKGHIKDATSAYLHGYYFFESQGLLEPVERLID